MSVRGKYFGTGSRLDLLQHFLESLAPALSSFIKSQASASLAHITSEFGEALVSDFGSL